MEFFPIALLVIIAPLAAALAAFLSGPNPIPPWVYRFGTMSHLLSFVAALALFFHVAAPGMPPISHPLLSSPWEVLSIGLSVDRLAAVMMVLIAGIGAIIHLYSIRFMGDEKGAGRFHSLLSLTIAVLLFMVSASSLLGLFLCWQLLSALLALLAYNHFHPPTARGAFRTFIMLRAGDLFFLSGLLVAYHFYRTTEFSLLFSRALTHPQTLVLSVAGSPLVLSANTLTALLIFVGAMSKSAQFPLHIWLPDSLYAPTPVHALLHAGIINAGGFLLNRLAPLYGHTPATLHTIFAVGLLTAILGACLMLTQNDIKKTLGYSTIGQMGYMIMECGLGAFSLAAFHLIAHGLFKATIFLNCGNVIHKARKDPRLPERTEEGERGDFSPLTWTTGLLTTLLLPLVLLLAVHGVLSIPSADSRGAIIFLFFSWITSAQAILTLYRLRALGSWKVAAIMLLTLGLVTATYLVAVERFTTFLYPDPAVAASYFRAGALPDPLFSLLILSASLSILLYWISALGRSHGSPVWMNRKLKEGFFQLKAHLYLFFLNRLYLDRLLARSGDLLRRGAQALDRSRLLLPVGVLVTLLPDFGSLASLIRLPTQSLLLLLLCALTLPLVPFHPLYRSLLTHLPGLLPVLAALLLPAGGFVLASDLLPHLPPALLDTLGHLALFGAFYGGFRAMLQMEVLPLLADTSLSFFSILWWHLSREGAATVADTLFAGGATLVTAGMILVWTRIRERYGNLPPERIGGLAEAMPRLSLPVILLAMAGAGLPPFGLFSGFLMLLLGSPDPVGQPASGLLILFVWFLASWTMFRLMQRLLFGERKGDLVARDLAGPEIAPLVLALIVLVVLGLIPYLAPSGGATDRALFPGKGAA